MPLNQKNPDNNIPEVKKLKKTNEPSEKESGAVQIIRLYAYVTIEKEGILADNTGMIIHISTLHIAPKQFCVLPGFHRKT